MEQAAEEAFQPLSVVIDQDNVGGDDTSVVAVEAQIDIGPLSIQGSLGPEVSLSGRTNHQSFGPQSNIGMLGYVVDQTLGPNRSDPIWWLRLLAAISLIAAAIIGAVFLPGYLHGIHATYRKVMLIATVGVPIAVAVITFLVSFWLASDPDGWSNWITGLSVANLSMFVGPLAVYWALKR